MATVDWKGFFSDPETYQLDAVNFQAAYDELIKADPEMAGFRKEDHEEFIRGMYTNFGPPAANRLSSGEIERITGQPTDVEPMVIRDPRLAAPPIAPPPQLAQQLPATRAGELMLQGEANVASGESAAQDWLSAIGLAPAAGAANTARVAEGIGQMAAATPPPQGLLEKVAVNAPQTAMFMAAMGPGALAGGAAGGAGAAAGAFSLGQAAAESIYEAGDVFKQAKAAGKTQAEAEDLASGVFGKNLVTIFMSELPVNLLTAGVGSKAVKVGQEIINQAGTNVGKRLVREMAKTGAEFTGATALNMLQEGGQEWLQQGFQEAALQTAGMFENTEEKKEAFKIGAVIGAMFGIPMAGVGAASEMAQAPAKAIAGAKAAKVQEEVQNVIDIMKMTPEKAGAEGKITLLPQPQIAPEEARLRATKDLGFDLTDKELEQFVAGRPLPVEEVAARVGKTVEEVSTALNTAEQQIRDTVAPPRIVEQPSAEGESVVNTLGRAMETLAVEAEQQGSPELAEARRKAGRQIEIVEPETLFERGLKGIASVLGGAPQVKFYRLATGEELEYDGVFVRKGLIAIDITKAGAAPKAVLGALFHELTHNAEAVNPEVYQGAIAALKNTPLWERGAKRAQASGAALTDKEVFANILQLEDVTTNVLRAMANYANVQDIAKAPGPVRAVAEWLGGMIRKIANKLNMTKDVTGLNLQQMERLNMIRRDPEIVRNAARHTLTILDMLKVRPAEAGVIGPESEVVPSAVQREEEEAPLVAPTEEQFSRTYAEMRAEEGGRSPRSLVSIHQQIRRFYELRRQFLAEETKAGLSPTAAKERADLRAREQAMREGRVLDPEDLNEEQKILTKFAEHLGTQVTFFEGGIKESIGGFSPTAGQVWINNKQTTDLNFAQILVHEITHDLHKRDKPAWRAVVSEVQRRMPEIWQAAASEIALLNSESYQFDTTEERENETLAWVMHLNANEFWNAVSAIGRERTAPPAFKQFLEWIGNLLKNAKAFFIDAFGEPAETFLGRDINVKAKPDILGLLMANTLATRFSKEGPYTAVDFKDLEGHVSIIEDELAKGGMDTEEEKLARTMLSEAAKKPKLKPPAQQEPEQMALFSRRTGYPPAAQTPQQLAAFRAQLRGSAMRGVKGKFWYELSAAAIMRLVGGNIENAKKFARLLAVYSPKNKVLPNWHYALTAWHRYIAGYSREDFANEQLHTKDNHQKAVGVLYDNAPWDGEKTNSFFSNLIEIVSEGKSDRVTIDVWMMRLMGFSGDAPNKAQYKEMEKEVKAVADKLGVTPYQAQAMMWVYSKTVWEANEPEFLAEASRRNITTHVPLIRNGAVVTNDNGKTVMVKTPEFEALSREMFQQIVKKDLKADVTAYPISESAMTTFATAMARRVAVLSQEAIPGDGTMLGLTTAPAEIKSEWTLAVERAFTDAVGDIIAQVMGFGPIANIDSMTLGNSLYYDNGQFQINPSRQILLPAAAKRGSEKSFLFEPASLDQVKFYSVIRGMLTGQNAVAGYRRFDTQGYAKDRNMAELHIGGLLTVDQQTELVTALGVALNAIGKEGWEIALYPTADGIAFMNLKQSGLNNEEFHAFLKPVLKGLSFKGKLETFQADTFYVQRNQSETGDVDTYADIIQGSERKRILAEVENRIADQLAKVYQDFSARGFGEPPAWVTARARAQEALERDVRTYPHFWHFSREAVTETGLTREQAGTGAAGQERARFRYDPKTGKIDPETAVIHLYTPTARGENVVISQAKYLNKIIAKLKLIPLTSPALTEMYTKHNGDPTEVLKELKRLGFDGLVDEERGMVQVNRDIDTSEITEGHEMTPEERRAWKGALKVEELEEEKSYDRIHAPKNVELTQMDVEYIASKLTDDGAAIFPKSMDERALRQHFRDVTPTSAGLVATNPIRPQFSMRVDETGGVPIGKEDVVEDEQKYGTVYSSTHKSSSWSLPYIDRWGRFLKKWQDSFVHFQTLNEVLADEGYDIPDHINVRLQEELYHGMVQEQTLRIEQQYITPMMKELRRLAKLKGINEQQFMVRFDEFLHARHAKERNAHLREAFRDRKLSALSDRRDKLRKKISDLNKELLDAEGPLHEARLQNTIRWYEMQLVNIEKQIDKVINTPVLDSGMSDAKADGVMKQTRLDGLDKDFSRIAARYLDPMLKRRLDALLEAKLITQQEYDNVAIYQHYVPLKGKAVEGDIEEMLDLYTGFPRSHGFDIRGAELPPVTGREADSKINPILAQSVVDSLSAFDRIERNKVALALLELAETYPNDKVWEVNKVVKKRVFDKKTGTIKEEEDWWARNQANVIGVKRDGETFYITLHQAGLAEAMKGLGVENVHKWVRALRGAMRTLAQLYTTWSPEFILTNFTRDWQQAIVSATTDMGGKAAANVAKNSSRAVRGILAANFPDAFGFLKNEYTDAYHEMKEAGGKVGFFGMRGVEDMHKAILAELKTGGAVATARFARRLGNYISSINEATENGIRLATYVEARRAGATKAVAASLAKNVTVNFNRRGDASGLAGSLYLFFNAGVQGVNRFFRSMKTPAGQRMAASMVAISFLVHTFSRAIMGEDDDGEDLYDKVSDFTHGRNWVIGYEKGKYVQVPMPYGFGVWAQLGKELERTMFSGEDRTKAAGEAAVRMLAGFTTHFSPLGETSFNQGWYALSRGFIPTMIEPVTDVLANETYWGGKIYPAKTPWDRRAPAYRVYPAKSAYDRMLQAITQKLNDMTGGSMYRGGVISLNSDGLSYVLDSYIGPTGRFLRRPFELGGKLAAGEDTLWNDWVILRRFLGETAPEYYVPGEYYDAIEDVMSAVEEREYLLKEGGAEDMKRWEKKHGWKTALKKPAQHVQEQIRKVRKSGDPNSKEIRDRVLQLQKAFVTRYLTEEEP